MKQLIAQLEDNDILICEMQHKIDTLEESREHWIDISKLRLDNVVEARDLNEVLEEKLRIATEALDKVYSIHKSDRWVGSVIEVVTKALMEIRSIEKSMEDDQ